MNRTEEDEVDEEEKPGDDQDVEPEMEKTTSHAHISSTRVSTQPNSSVRKL